VPRLRDRGLDAAHWGIRVTVAVELELNRGWRLTGELPAPEAATAAEEIEAALGPGGDGEVEIALSHDEGVADGFRRRAAPRRVELHGDSPRGLLFGVYQTLEELGASWQWPGERPEPARGRRLEEQLEHAPSLPGRCLVLGESALVEDAESWIVWAARARLNSLFVHVSTQAAPVGAAPEAAWRERREEALPLARARGMTIEHGGHLLTELVTDADARALAEGRTPEPARRALEHHLRAHPEADVLHLWGADVPAGGGTDASEAALRAANALAELTEDAGSDAQVAFLAYHDTEEVPRGVKPRRNVCLVFAPRERCYEHSLADEACSRNAHHRDLLFAQIEHFRTAGAAPPRVFEYWFDAILFADGVPDLGATIAEDLAFYRDAGVHTVQVLITGHGHPPSPHPNLSAFARHAWGVGLDRL
jgi:hypothetical protein